MKKDVVKGMIAEWQPFLRLDGEPDALLREVNDWFKDMLSPVRVDSRAWYFGVDTERRRLLQEAFCEFYHSEYSTDVEWISAAQLNETQVMMGECGGTCAVFGTQYHASRRFAVTEFGLLRVENYVLVRKH